MKKIYRSNVILPLLLLVVVSLFASTGNAEKKKTTPKSSATIGGTVWMTNNLSVDRYRNGDMIPEVQDPDAWSKLTTGAWCTYENSSENGKTYGKLYNWYAVNDPRGLAPAGWHAATDAEWQNLVTATGGEKGSGTALKSKNLWTPPVVGADNRSGFTAIPSGYRSSNGKFSLLGTNASFWSATESSNSSAWYRDMYNAFSAVYRITSSKTQGFAVRCVKD